MRSKIMLALCLLLLFLTACQKQTSDDPIVASLLSPAGLARAREDLTMGPEPGADADAPPWTN